MNANDPVLLDVQGHVAVISLNQPEKHNAMGDAADALFFRYLDLLRTDKRVRVVVWRGNGPSFSSGRDGADLDIRRSSAGDFDAISRRQWSTRLLYEFPVPIICALKGWVLGAQFERVMLCDLRIAAENTKLGLPEVDHGMITDSAGIAKLFEIGGAGLALDLALSGRRIGAEEALRLGLVSHVVPDDRLEEVVMEMAHRVATRPPYVVRLIREHVQALANSAVVSTLRRELVAQTLVFTTDDYLEYREAKATEREPVFAGR